MQVLVPDYRGVDQNFHDVTIVDMGEVPESAVSIPGVVGSQSTMAPGGPQPHGVASIVTHRCCLSLWTLVVSTCRQVGFRRRQLVWMDFSPEVSRYPKGGGDLLGLICPELGVAPLVDPGKDLEDERPTPVGSPLAAVDECMPLSPTSGVDVDVTRALLEVGVLPAMVTPIVDPAVGFSMSPATYPMPPVPMMSIGNSIPLEVAPPADLAVGSPARSEITLRRVASPASVASSGLPPSSLVLRPAPDVDPPSSLAAIEQKRFTADGAFRGFPLTSGSPDTESDG